MDYQRLYEETGQPFTGRRRRTLEAFLQQAGLRYEEQISYTVNLVDDDGTLLATGSLNRNVLQCIAVAPQLQGMGLTAKIVTHLMNRCVQLGYEHLFLFTKPENKMMFSGLGFYPVAETQRVLLMENHKDGLHSFLKGLKRPAVQGARVGAIVANADPFTNGHLHLVSRAAEQCDTLHLFILSEDGGLFSPAERYQMAAAATKDLGNVVLHPSSDYLISSAVFPTYFLKDQASAGAVNCELDLHIFGRYFVKELGITHRFVGEEPFCRVTRAYNAAMKELLPPYGVEVIELPRLCCGETAVSASHVRRALLEGDMQGLRALVPKSTYDYLVYWKETGKVQ